MVLFLSLLACQSNPLEHPDFLASTEGPLQIALAPEASGFRVGGPLVLHATVSSVPDSPSQPFDVHPNSVVGRSKLDTWTIRHVSGVSDPSAWWEDSAPRRMVPSPIQVSPDAPLAWDVPLCEWARFDRAGTWALQLETLRSGELVRSNAIRVEVAGRDAQADAARVAAIIEAVPAAAPADRGALFRELGCIGSPDLVELALAGLASGEDDESGWVLVLAMHPDAKRVKSALDSALVAQDVPVGMGHLRALEAVGFDALFERPVGRMPYIQNDPAMAEFREASEARTSARARLTSEAWARLRAAIDDKTPAARGRSLGTLALYAIREDMPEEDAFWPILRRSLSKVPPRTLVELLGRYWDDVGDASVVPELVAVLRDTTAHPAGSPDAAAAEEVRSLALKRVVQLDPSAGLAEREALVANPARPVADVDEALRSLPSVSEATQAAIVAGLATAPDRVQQARLLSYVSADHLAAVEAAWAAEPADVPTGVMAGYAAYFHDHAPAKAAPLLARYGADRFELLEQVGELVDDPASLNALAIRGLMSTDQAVIFKSSDYLIAHGTPEVLPELKKLVGRAKGEQEEALLGAICAGRSWLIDGVTRTDLEERVEDHRAGMVIRSTVTSDASFVLVKGSVRDGRPVMSLNYRDYVGAEAIKAKAEQFQPGLRIHFTWLGLQPEEGVALFRPILQSAGLDVFEAEP
ncbi:MAG: hypothetical protein R3F61_34960 [Myxococcota bacterium]